jgi:type II secretory pathway pseudopilin PulG
MAVLRSLRRRLASDEQGSLLIEVLVSASILLTVAAGVVLVLQTAHAQSGLQRAKALATDVAQNKLDEIRARDYNTLRALNEETTADEGGMRFSVATRVTPVAQTDAPGGCSTSRARDYYSVKTTVSWNKMGNRKPVVLDTLVAAPIGAGGGLVVTVTGGSGQPTPNIPLSLSSGGGTATTDVSGCARWDAVSVGTGYGLSGSVPGYVKPDGEQDIAVGGISIVAEDTARQTIAYDRAGTIKVQFKERPSGSAGAIDVPSPSLLPDGVTLFNASARVVREAAQSQSGAIGTWGPFYPFSSSYQVYADTCTAAQPGAGAPLSGRASGIVPAGGSVNAILELPSLGLRFTNNGTAPAAGGITVGIKTACGTVFTRTVKADGTLANPGLPYSTNLTVCARNAGDTMRIVRTGLTNTAYAAPSGASTEVRLTTSGTTCPFSY